MGLKRQNCALRLVESLKAGHAPHAAEEEERSPSKSLGVESELPVVTNGYTPVCVACSLTVTHSY